MHTVCGMITGMLLKSSIQGCTGEVINPCMDNSTLSLLANNRSHTSTVISPSIGC